MHLQARNFSFDSRPQSSLLEKAAGQQRISARQKSSVELTIKTAEGDEITLSAEARSFLQGESGSGETNVRAGSRSTVSITVKGSLNQQELEDIRKIASALGQTIQQAQNGQTSEAAETLARSATNSETLAQVQFRYQAKQKLSYAERAYQAIGGVD